MVKGYPGDLIMPWESVTYCAHSAMNEKIYQHSFLDNLYQQPLCLHIIWLYLVASTTDSSCKVCLKVMFLFMTSWYRLYRQSLEQLRWGQNYKKMLSELQGMNGSMRRYAASKSCSWCHDMQSQQLLRFWRGFTHMCLPAPLYSSILTQCPKVKMNGKKLSKF